MKNKLFANSNFLIVAGALLGLLFLFQTASAQVKTVSYEELNVDYFVNEDSSVDIEEEFVMKYDGEFHGTSRSITLIDDENYQLCQTNPNLQCGGFDFMYIKEVIGGDGEVLDPDDYEINLITVGAEKRVEVRYEFAKDGRTFNSATGERFKWKIKYKVFGSIGYFDNYDFFYWNTAFADRTDVIEKHTIRVHFPKDFTFNPEEDLRVFNPSHYVFENKVLTLTVDSPLIPYGAYPDNTVLLKFPKGIIDKPASIKLIPKVKGVNLGFVSPDFKMEIEGKEIYNQGNEYKGIPTGKQTLTFKSDNFNSYTANLDLKSGEYREIEFETEASPLFKIGMLVASLCVCAGMLLALAGFVWPLSRFYLKGRDKGGTGVIIPLYSPPEGMSPALLGSLKDEKVDPHDISGAIIDAAYQGYVKIVQLDKKGKDFELQKLKEFTGLPDESVKILSTIFSFGDADKVQTSDLKNTFYTKIPGIESHIYQKMVDEGFFDKKPDSVRGSYSARGGCALFASIFICFSLNSITGGAVIALIAFPLVAIFLYGIMNLGLAKYMPAKTEKGTIALEKVKGFLMYMETAEKYRLQNLTPETFERYLSYAVVFGIEKQWAKKFEGIYQGVPSWYQGYGDPSGWNTIMFANSLSNFSRYNTSAMTSKPSSSGSSSGWSGGGWSGGGGFSGGFSGGGGGGGGGSSW